MSLTSAWSITRSVNPPRAVFTDFPLGHTAGKPHDAVLQRNIVRDALAALQGISQPGTIIPLPYQWSDDDAWKDAVMRPQRAGANQGERMADDRRERWGTPQYQHPADEALASADPACPGCLWLED